MQVELFTTNDRLGGNLTSIISQVLYAIHNKYHIKYSRSYLRPVPFAPHIHKYINSIFFKIIFDIVDWYNEYNDRLIDITNAQYIEIASNDYETNITRTLYAINCDLFSAFRKLLIEANAQLPNPLNIPLNVPLSIIPFDPQKTIAVHLRLGDTKNCADYNGSICFDFFQKAINEKKKITAQLSEQIRKETNTFCNFQAPLSNHKIMEQIDNARKKYPDYRVVIITSPNENKTFPFEYIQHDDETIDLYLLSIASIVILSRSTFALSSLFFNTNLKEAYVPLWGHLAYFGFNTKYNQLNAQINYF